MVQSGLILTSLYFDSHLPKDNLPVPNAEILEDLETKIASLKSEKEALAESVKQLKSGRDIMMVFKLICVARRTCFGIRREQFVDLLAAVEIARKGFL